MPELVLQNDGHLFRVLRAQPVGNAHAVAVGVERDEEMVVARQAFLGGVAEYAAHHAAQRLLGQKIVADLVGHAGFWNLRLRDSGPMLAHDSAKWRMQNRD